MSARAAGLLLASSLFLLPALAAPGSAAQAQGGMGALPSAEGPVPPGHDGMVGEVSDVPAGHGRIVGHLAHPDGSARAAGADVILYAVRSGASPGVRRTKADAEGRFTFEGVSTDADVAYLLGARFGGVPFVGQRVVFASGQTEVDVAIPVLDRTRNAGDVRVDEATLRVERIGSELVMNETAHLSNSGKRVVYVTPEERAAGARPAFHAELPAGFKRFALPYTVTPEGIVREGRDVRFFGPLYPGKQDLTFSWTVPAPAGRKATDLTLRLPSGAARLTVLVPEGVELTSTALSAPKNTKIEGITYAKMQAGPVAPGGRIHLRLHVPPARTAPDALKVDQARAFLEADNAAVVVNEEYYLTVAGDGPVVGTPAHPLLRVPVPPEARDLRYGATFEEGITAENGHLVLRGPVPPGDSRLDLRYRLPVTAGGAAHYERRFDADIPVLSVYVADTGLEADSSRLHRRRPVRTDDERTYLHFEGFRIAPGETVDLALKPLPARASAPRGLRVVLVGGVALMVAFFLAQPLLRRDTRLAARSAPGEAERRERDALYQSIRDLDHDFETGKVSAEDHAQMRSDLRQRAVVLLQAERRARREAQPAASEAPTVNPDACPACGSPVAADARFCAQCGRALARDGVPA